MPGVIILQRACQKKNLLCLWKRVMINISWKLCLAKILLTISGHVGLRTWIFSLKSFPKDMNLKLPTNKGYLISKCLFDAFTFFQKTNENKPTSSKVEFVSSFFGRNVGMKKWFRICLTFSLHWTLQISWSTKTVKTGKQVQFLICISRWQGRVGQLFPVLIT